MRHLDGEFRFIAAHQLHWSDVMIDWSASRASSRRGLGLLLVAAGFLVVVMVPLRQVLVPAFYELAAGQLAQFQHHLQSLGPWGPVFSVALLIAGALGLPVPVTVIMVADGLIYGTQAGTLISLVGGLLGAVTAYLLGRHFSLASLAMLERLVPGMSARTSAGPKPFVTWGIVLWHWIPGLPCNPMSYAAGCMHMPLASFLGFTTIGLLPACAITAYLGVQAAGDMPSQYWFSGLLIVGVLWLAWRAVQRRNVSHSNRMMPFTTSS
ncbi:MAG TPA: VTT domain-containing protein [Vicinamibacterales bacterium]